MGGGEGGGVGSGNDDVGRGRERNWRQDNGKFDGIFQIVVTGRGGLDDTEMDLLCAKPYKLQHDTERNWRAGTLEMLDGVRWLRESTRKAPHDIDAEWCSPKAMCTSW